MIISYSTLAAICTELMNAGFGTTYGQEAANAFEKVILFRETRLGLHHADTAVAYHDYAYFWYICGVYDKSLEYNEKARRIYEELFSIHSISRLRSLNTTALVYKETGKTQEANDIFRHIIETAEQMSNDYLGDVADFALNYAQVLREEGKKEEASIYYDKCISIWTKMSKQGNRKLAVAHQDVADMLFVEGDVENALLHYDAAQTYKTEDFYIEVEVIDSMAACLLLGGRVDEGIQKLVSLLRILVQYNAHDDETKFDLCRNLACVIEANSEEEKLWKAKLMNSIVEKTFSSFVLMKGTFRKVLIFMLVGVAHIIGLNLFGTPAALRSPVLCFYLATEGGSVIKNTSRLGLPIPEKLKTALLLLHEKPVPDTSALPPSSFAQKI